MQLKTFLIILVSVVVVISIFSLVKFPEHGKKEESAQDPDLSSRRDVDVCHRQVLEVNELQDYYGKVVIIYDFSTIPPTQFKEEITSLLTNLNQNLISEIILVQNNCEDKATVDAASTMALSRRKMRVVIIDAEEVVSTGRARIEGVRKTSAPFILFISAGSVPDSDKFLESMLYVVKQSPEAVVCPSSKGNHQSYLTWSLDFRESNVPPSKESAKAEQLSLIDNSVFFIRSDLYKAVGGYDSFFFKRDSADRLSFSLAVWSCGGSILQAQCAHVKHSETSFQHSSEQAVQYLQHAKHIQEVHGGSLSRHITYPGIEFYKPSAYDLHAIKSRKELYHSLGCMTMEWYSHKFSSGLSVVNKVSKLHQPNYIPLLPVYKPIQPQQGKWFLLYAGHCVKVDTDSVLGLSWCPVPLSEQYKFTWQDGGQIKAQDKCVTVHSGDLIIRVEDCKESSDVTQLFIYDKTTRQITAKHNGQCLTHINGPNNRQVLKTMECSGHSPFNKFVLNNDY